MIRGEDIDMGTIVESFIEERKSKGLEPVGQESFEYNVDSQGSAKKLDN